MHRLAALVLVVALGYAYFRLCRAVGFAAALPFAVIACRVGHWRLRWLLDGIGFAKSNMRTRARNPASGAARS